MNSHTCSKGLTKEGRKKEKQKPDALPLIGYASPPTGHNYMEVYEVQITASYIDGHHPSSSIPRFQRMVYLFLDLYTAWKQYCIYCTNLDMIAFIVRPCNLRL